VGLERRFHTASVGKRQPGKLANGFDPSRLNLGYATSGDKSSIPLNRVFDDGQFTYFMFDPNAEIPSVYAVGPDGTESIVNTRPDH
jgi:type IV secretion system protein VirB9